MTAPSLVDRAKALAQRAKRASAAMSVASTAQKNKALELIAAELAGPARLAILEENELDVKDAIASGLATSLIDRLKLDDGRLMALSKSVHEIVSLADPVGAVDGLTTRPSGIQVGRMRVPLGVVLFVYESRPNTTIDASALCLKAGNAVVLRGGKEALRSNHALASVVRDALKMSGLPEDAVLFVDDVDRDLLYALLAQGDDIDLAVPRGGPSLIAAVREHAQMPMLAHAAGVCHVYVHASADLDVAERVIVNAKVSRPGVCNALECVVVDAMHAHSFIPRIHAALAKHGVTIKSDARGRAVVPSLEAASDADFDTEFLALTMALAVVDNYAGAIEFIRAHGSRHTESIIANDHDVAMRFLREVDASCVMVNASTRFNDGGELGLGAELGISTTKLHAYGPMGLEELCARKWIVLGHGETR